MVNLTLNIHSRTEGLVFSVMAITLPRSECETGDRDQESRCSGTCRKLRTFFLDISIRPASGKVDELHQIKRIVANTLFRVPLAFIIYGGLRNALAAVRFSAPPLQDPSARRSLMQVFDALRASLPGKELRISDLAVHPCATQLAVQISTK